MTRWAPGRRLRAVGSISAGLLVPNAGAKTAIATMTRSTAAPIQTLRLRGRRHARAAGCSARSEEHTSELQSLAYLVCRLLLEKKNRKRYGKQAYCEESSRA